MRKGLKYIVRKLTILLLEGETYKLYTTYEKAYNSSWLLTTGYEWTYFYVETCTDVHLAMAAIPGTFSICKTYEGFLDKF